MGNRLHFHFSSVITVDDGFDGRAACNRCKLLGFVCELAISG